MERVRGGSAGTGYPFNARSSHLLAWPPQWLSLCGYFSHLYLSQSNFSFFRSVHPLFSILPLSLLFSWFPLDSMSDLDFSLPLLLTTGDSELWFIPICIWILGFPDPFFFFFFFFFFFQFFFKVLAYLGEGVWFCCEVIILGFLIFDILILMLFPILKVKSLKQFTSNCCAGYVAEPRNAVPVRIWRHLWIQWHSLAFDFIVLILMNMYISSLNGKQRSFDHYGNTRTWNQSEVMLPYNWGIGLSMPYSLAIFGTICFIALNLCMIIKLSFIFYFLFQNDH